MFTYSRCRRILIGALAGAALTALSVSVASSQARQIDVRELPRSTPQNPQLRCRTGRDLPGKSRQPDAQADPDGPRLARHPIRDAATPKGGLRDGRAPLAGSLGPWHPRPLRPRNDLVPGGDDRRRSTTELELRSVRPARPGATMGRRRPAGPLLRRHRSPARRVDAVGSNPPEVRIVHDRSFRLAALTFAGRPSSSPAQCPRGFPAVLPIGAFCPHHSDPRPVHSRRSSVAELVMHG